MGSGAKRASRSPVGLGLWCTTAALAALAAAPQPGGSHSTTAANSLTTEEESAGWRLLFDGRSTAAWRKFRGTELPERWKVSEGALVFDPQGGEHGDDIVTQEEYASFDFR